MGYALVRKLVLIYITYNIYNTYLARTPFGTIREFNQGFISDMYINEFDYNLPEDKIAIYPPTERGSTKLLVLHRETGELEHKMYRDLPDLLNSGDLLVLNDTKVIKARLIANKDNGTEIELLLLEKHPDQELGVNEALALHHGKLELDQVLFVKDKRLKIKDFLSGGIVKIESNCDLYKLAETEGEVPLPPYLHRNAEPEDTERYQTVFAKESGSVAAPTASLNLTEEILDRIRAKGVEIAYITLHVGLGTFLPVRAEKVEDHEIHSEWCSIPPKTITAIRTAISLRTSAAPQRIIAVGTTVTRALEAAASLILNPSSLTNLSSTHSTFYVPHSSKPISGEAQIFIYPGYEFKIVDALLTNFHAPRSTVLLMATAFCNPPKLHAKEDTSSDLLKRAYQEALSHDYKFLSYGDSMLIM